MRPSGRSADQMRAVSLEPGFAKHAEGSCLVRFGDTHVLVTASLEEKVPPFLRNSGQGWVTAEYGMLPRSTHTRTDREAARGIMAALAPGKEGPAKDADAKFLSAVTERIDNFPFPGGPAAVYREPRLKYLADQVRAHLGDLGNFFKGSAQP